MALKFFRRHKRLFFVLMIAAVFSMVFFTVLTQFPLLWDRITGQTLQGKTTYTVYDREIPRIEVWRIRDNLRRGYDLRNIVNAYAEQVRQQPGGMQKADLLNRYLGDPPMSVLYTSDFFTPNDELKKSVLEATIALLTEADMAGVSVTREMAREHIAQWQANIDPQIYSIIVEAVAGSPQQIEALVSTVQQEMILSTYFHNLKSGFKVFKGDVVDSFRLSTEQYEILKVDIPSSDFLDQVGQPSDDRIRMHFEEYRAVDPIEDPAGIGYRVPDRIKLRYLVVLADKLRSQVDVTEEELREVYEQIKDPRFVIEEPEEDPQEDGEQNGESDDGDDVDARDEEQPADSEDASGEGDASDDATADDSDAEEGESDSADDEDTDEEPEKKFRPFEEVRDQLHEQLLELKTQQTARERAHEAMSKLRRTPSLTLENVYDTSVMKLYESKDWMSQEEAFEAEMIGGSFRLIPQQGQRPQRQPFALLAFQVAPLAVRPLIQQDQPQGLLTDAEGNYYVFTVTDVQKNHPAPSLDEARDRVVADLRQIDAHALAEADAEKLLAAAREAGSLAEAAEAMGYEAGKPRYPISRRSARLGNDQAESVVEAFEQNRTFGKVDYENYRQAQVFEIVKPIFGQKNQWRAWRSNVTAQEIVRGRARVGEWLLGRSGDRYDRQAQRVGKDAFAALFERSELKQVAPIDPDSEAVKAGDETDADAGDSED